MRDPDRLILEHYRQEAAEHALAPSSTMADLVTRDIEVEAILACVAHAQSSDRKETALLEVGCGNGYLLHTLRDRFPALRLVGTDYSPDMVRLARNREMELCDIQLGDVRSLSFGPAAFDLAVSERCVINVLDEGEQDQALRELYRVLRPGGHLVLIEAFTDGLENLNRARLELGLPENVVPDHNRWFDKQRFLEFVGELFEEVHDKRLPPRNLLSTHYFVSRVLYPAITKREVLYNTEFVRFFRFLPPEGDFSPIQLFFLRKRESA